MGLKLKELCKNCGMQGDCRQIYHDDPCDFEYCAEVQESELTDRELECELNGDKNNCQECVYYPDYEWDEDKKHCCRR